MLPIVTPDEMRVIDEASPEPVDVLIERVGHAVAVRARAMLGGTYGRRIVVIAGTGNNGADGRAAARTLRRWGATVDVVGLDGPLPRHNSDLIVDAAVGTQLRREYVAPDVGGALVLAVDLPSGVDGLTGEAKGVPLQADETVVIAAMKPGNVFGAGHVLSGRRRLIDIGLDVEAVTDIESDQAHRPCCFLLEDTDVVDGWPRRAPDHHKWKAAVLLVGGSAGMGGAIGLTARGALRAGASHCFVARPTTRESEPVAHGADAVGIDLGQSWEHALRSVASRVSATVIGPGLRADDETSTSVRRLVESTVGPVVLDAGGLEVLGNEPTWLGQRIELGRSPAVLTPHDGEFARLGGLPGADRIDATRRLAERCGAVVLRKGPTTVVAGPDGEARVISRGDARLATAGSGDVLAGVIGAGLAGGCLPLEAASLGAHLHGMAGCAGPSDGVIASDLPDLVGAVRASWGPSW